MDKEKLARWLPHVESALFAFVSYPAQFSLPKQRRRNDDDDEEDKEEDEEKEVVVDFSFQMMFHQDSG